MSVDDPSTDEDIVSAARATQSETCPECAGRLVSDRGETACTECGLVVEESRIDHGPEWRSFEDDGTDPERTGTPLTPTRHDRGLSTEIGWKTDASGNTIPGKKRRQLGRLRREHSRGRWRSKADRNLARGLSEVRRVAGALGLSDSIRDQACRLFRCAQDEGHLPGRSIESMAVASVYAACRCNGLPRTLQELSAVSAVGRSRVENAYRVLNRELGLPAVPRSPRQFVPGLASAVGVSEETRLRAERLARQAEDAGLANGRNPAGVAAGCLYEVATANSEGVTQGELGECADVSRMTVRTRWHEVQAMIDRC